MRQLLERGEEVRACVYDTEAAHALDDLPCEIVTMDVTDTDAVAAGFDGADETTTVIHCAGIVSIGSMVTEAVRTTNVDGTRNILDACREHQVRRLVHVSSVHVIPEEEGVLTEVETFDPELVVGEYAKTKTEATALVKDAASDIDAVIVHPSGIVGPGDYGDSHLTRLIRDLTEGTLPIVVTGGYNFVDVRDVASGAISAADKGRRGESYLLSGHEVTVGELGAIVAKTTGRRRPVEIPLWVAKAIVPLAEWISRLRGTAPLFTRYSLHTLEAPANFSHAKATSELDYEPRPVTETITDTVRWLQERYQD